MDETSDDLELPETDSEILTEIVEPIAEEIEEPVVEVPKRRLYFINEIVEWDLTKYKWTGCTKVHLRDKIMSSATELIRQIIRKQGLHTIYPGHDDSAFGDLLQTAWTQIERTLYKYRSRPHCRKCFNPDRPSDSALFEPADRDYDIMTLEDVCSIHGKCRKCGTPFTTGPLVDGYQGYFGGTETVIYRGLSKVFNMWSQVTRTVILAYIKKDGRDRKNSTSYMTHLDDKTKPLADAMKRFLSEAHEICQYNDDYLVVLNSLKFLLEHDPKPHEGIISKLVEHSKLSRVAIANFMQAIRSRSLEFTDSPINKSIDPLRNERRRVSRVEFEEE